jgi:hypothetical protein
MSHTFLAGVFDVSLEIEDLQLSLLDRLMVQRAFALIILTSSRLDCKGFERNSFTALFLQLIAILQSSLNHGFCLVFGLPLVLGIAF